MDNAIRERAMPRHQIWYSNGRYVFCSLLRAAARSGPIGDSTNNGRSFANPTEPLSFSGRPFDIFFATATDRTACCFLERVSRFIDSWEEIGYSILLILFSSLYICIMYVCTICILYVYIYILFFLYQSRQKKTPRNDIRRFVDRDAFATSRRTIRHGDKVRARSYLKVRYAIGDISMPNISYKAAPLRAVILNIIYDRSYKDPGCLRGMHSADERVCVFHTSTPHDKAHRVQAPVGIWTQRTANRKTISIHCFAWPINIVNIGLLNYRSNLVRRSADLHCYIVNSPLRWLQLAHWYSSSNMRVM